MRAPSIPYTILALAPFAGELQQFWRDAPLPFDRREPDKVLAMLHPSLFIPVPETLCSAGGLQLSFQRLKDFTPDGLIGSQPCLADLAAAGRFLDTARKRGFSTEETAAGLKKWPDLPPVQLQSQEHKTVPTDQSETTGALDKILSMVAMPETGGRAETGSAGFFRPFDQILRQLLVHIFQDSAFRQMEAAWQGVQLLAAQGGMNGTVGLQLVPVTRDTLEETLVTLPGSVIRNLPSLILVDCAFDSSPRSIHLLEVLARCAHTLLVPALAWITAAFFRIDTWQDMARLPFLPHHLDTQEFAKWRKLQMSEAGRWLGLVCNRLLCRFPYGPENRTRQADFSEKELPWVAPVWATACLAGQSMFKTGWPTKLNDWQQRRVNDLGLNLTQPGKPIPLETVFSDSRMDQLLGAGIMPLATARGKDFAFLGGEVMVSADVSFSYQALLGRFTQFVLWCRDHFDEDPGEDGIAAKIETAFQLFREQQGEKKTGRDLQVSIGSRNAEQRLPVRIQWTPPRNILPAGQEIILEFYW